MIGNWEFLRSWQLSAWLSIESMNKILATAIHLEWQNWVYHKKKNHSPFFSAPLLYGPKYVVSSPAKPRFLWGV